MAYRKVRDDSGRLVCEYDSEEDRIRIRRDVDGNKRYVTASLKEIRNNRANITDSNE